MFSPCRKYRTALAALLAFLATPLLAEEQCCGDGAPVNRERDPHVLRITADPNNLPFSNQRLEGFENKLAELVANELGMRVEWSWRAQRRGFFRETLKAGASDLVLGVPKGFDMALTTAPYYRSAYAFVYRKDRGINLASLDDPKLRELTIGVQLIGDDGTNTPPAHALSRRGIIQNVRGYTVFGDYSEENPPARIVRAVAEGEVDVALVWGPLAGYFARRQAVPLEVVPLEPQVDSDGLPFAFNIAMGVRKRDEEFKQRVEEVLKRKQPEIDRILDEYGVVRVTAPPRGEKKSDARADGPKPETNPGQRN